LVHYTSNISWNIDESDPLFDYPPNEKNRPGQIIYIADCREWGDENIKIILESRLTVRVLAANLSKARDEIDIRPLLNYVGLLNASSLHKRLQK
jgi:hypothetical protein